MTTTLVNEARGSAATTIPVIDLWGRLVVPLQGDVGDAEMERLVADVLQRIQQVGARGLVVDVSGVWLVDSHLCAALGRLVSATRVMGARSVLSGLKPEIVLTLQEMGFELRGVETALGLEEALELLGVRAEVDDDDPQLETWEE